LEEAKVDESHEKVPVRFLSTQKRFRGTLPAVGLAMNEVFIGLSLNIIPYAFVMPGALILNKSNGGRRFRRRVLRRLLSE